MLSTTLLQRLALFSANAFSNAFAPVNDQRYIFCGWFIESL